MPHRHNTSTQFHMNTKMNTKKGFKIQKTTRYGGAIIGALAGAAIGIAMADVLLLFSAGGITLDTLAMLTAGFAAGGLFLGAGFGIIRNIRSQIPDNADLWFSAWFSRKKKQPPAIALVHETDKSVEKPNYAITTIVYDTCTEYPQADTHQRDKVLASARQALLSMDPTKAIFH